MSEQLGLFDNEPPKRDKAAAAPPNETAIAKNQPDQSNDVEQPPATGAVTDFVPIDQTARDRIAHALDETLFVEAGAGSGKTRSLVARVVSLIRSGIDVDNIAAITFTEKASSELRDRIRRQLEDEVDEPATSPADRARFDAALDALDGAAISTLHGFAQRVLSEHPVEAELPPAVEVQDEISSQVAFEERWQRFLDQLLEDQGNGNDFLIANAVGVSLDHLQQLARQFNNNWDLVAEHVALHPAATAEPLQLDLAHLVDQLAALTELRDECADPTDRLFQKLGDLEAYVADLRSSFDDIELLERLVHPSVSLKVGNVGKQGSWPATGFSVADVREEVVDTRTAIEEAIAEVANQALHRLAEHVAVWTLDAAEERRTEGRLEYHDLLVRARQLLRNPVSGQTVRATMRERYSRLLLDEFQDTDPIQIELACLIASPDPDGTTPWNELTIPPGSLFFVGDPKQSIYRFRRADINLFLDARTSFADEPVQLTSNFRTTTPIINWVNHVFGRLIQFKEGSQPEYQPLTAVRAAAPGGNPVAVIGRSHPDTADAETLRRAEAADVANTICLAMQERWQVDDGNGGWRDAQLGDITILLPARTSLVALERELERVEVPYRAESSSLVYNTSEVRDLLAVLRSIADPTDELALATSLRSALFGCGDDDLYTFKIEHQGAWNHQTELPETLPHDHPVAEALVFLGELHQSQMWMTPSELLERIVRERRLLELGFTDRRPRDLWRRIRFLIDQARAYAESEGGGLRDYLAWAELQSAEGARVAEAVLPETDDDSVRIMTIHGSKGLEFPITILSGLTTQAQRKRGGVQVIFPGDGEWVIRVKKDLESLDFEKYAALDEQLGFHETLRLLYVAATRARDHLVVSTHHKQRKNAATDLSKLTMAELIACVLDDAPPFEHLDPDDSAVEPPALQPADPLLDRSVWEVELSQALELGARQRVLAATTIAKLASAAAAPPEASAPSLVEDPARDPGLAKDSRNLDLPPWQKGRYGTAIGRAVHGTLQTTDLVNGVGIAETAAAQAAAEGVLGREAIVESLSRSALAATVVREAVSSRYWREMYVAAPLSDDLVIEGYIDLLYRTPDGLVVVDYKTDAVPDDETLLAKLSRYRLQGATYALAVEEATAETVARVVFVFLDEESAIERDVVNLRAAIDEVRATALGGLTSTDSASVLE